jgi:hypothetical protein
MTRRRRPKVVLRLSYCAIGLAMATGSFSLSGCASRTTHTYTCSVCRQNWKRETIKVFGVPVGGNREIHQATDHVATYHGGGYAHDDYFLWINTMNHCGGHREQSGDAIANHRSEDAAAEKEESGGSR